jgi:midasin
MHHGVCLALTARCVHRLQAPVGAVQRRLQALLAEWPEHPLLVQLQDICSRILTLPACGPLKAALTGVELLLSRAQTWEEGAASHVSLSAQLQMCAALATRWRSAEVNAWPHALAAVTRAAADAANSTWFPLHRLMCSVQPPEQPEEAAVWLRSIATALEEFLRGASLGEFERRVTLLWAFYGHATLDAAASPAWAPLAALLCTLHRYYLQFVDDVNRVLDAARLPIEAKLKDHVKLAKWEVRPLAPAGLAQRCCNPSPYGCGIYAASTSQGIAYNCAAVWVGATTLCVSTQSCRHIHIILASCAYQSVARAGPRVPRVALLE